LAGHLHQNQRLQQLLPDPPFWFLFPPSLSSHFFQDLFICIYVSQKKNKQGWVGQLLLQLLHQHESQCQNLCLSGRVAFDHALGDFWGVMRRTGGKETTLIPTPTPQQEGDSFAKVKREQLGG